MHGAWLGRCVGCALGKPVERLMGEKDVLASWQQQKTYLTAIAAREWPLNDYFPATSPAVDRIGPLGCTPSQREHIAYMESDDDIRYTVLGQIVMQRYGRHFRSAHVANLWTELLPYQQVCTAETQAYRNMVIRYDHFRRPLTPERAAEVDAKTDWQWLTHYVNPYREWIGAQIRVDSYAYAAAGNPQLAAEFAWRDARISHVKNGIYGAMFCSAMIAAAFATSDVREIVRIGLSEIPRTSRLHAEMTQVVAICEKYGCDFDKFEAVIAETYEILGHRYRAVHTNNNAGVCVLALLLSGGDFAKRITLAVMGGLDTNCNGATVGSIVGAITGAAKAPKHWTGRLNDKLLSLVPDYHPIAISQCARNAVDIFRSVLSEAE
jgi:ADP-ribosylglycohydrolase